MSAAASSIVLPKRTNLYGPQILDAAESLRQSQKVSELWPFEWEYAPPGSKQDQGYGFVATPAVATPTQVCLYQVPDGLDFYPTGIVFDLLGVGWAPNDFTWSLTINSPVSVASPQALPYDGFTNVPFAMGSLTGLPWPITKAERNRQHSRDQLRLVVTNNAVVGGTFVGVIKGYVLPSAR